MSASVVSSSAVGLLDRHYSPSPTRSESPEVVVEPQQSWQERSDDVEMQEGPPATAMTATTAAAPSTEIIEPAPSPVMANDFVETVAAVAEVTDVVLSKQRSNEQRQETIGGLLAALTTTKSNEFGPNNNAIVLENDMSINQPVDDLPQDAPQGEEPAMKLRKTASPPAESPISEMLHEDEVGGQDMDQTSGQAGTAGNTSTNNAYLPLPQTNTNGMLIEQNTVDISNNSGDLLQHDALLPEPTLMDGTMLEISAEDIQAMHRYQQEHPMTLHDLEMHMAEQMPEEQMPINIRRQYHAFARLEFPDGTFYLNTYQCELGRDQHAYQDAMRREAEDRLAAEEEQKQPKEWSGVASQRVQSIKASESQVQRSVVSESGGFAGVDEKPVEAYGDKKSSAESKSRSQASDGSVVRPVDVLHNPFMAPYDYNKDAIYPPAPPAEDEIDDGEQAAPVTDEHMPNPKSCPLIPIHPTPPSADSRFPPMSDAENMRNISRRHLRIEWDWKKEAWYMTVLGRNGAFFDDDWKPPGKRMKLFSGAKMQVSAVEIVFRLPNQAEDSDDQDMDSVSNVDGDLPMEDLPTDRNGAPVKLKLKIKTDASPPAGVNGETKRRGPGRPPKNGVMSQREMKEREKAEKEAKARTSISNGVPDKEAASVPPSAQRKPSKSQLPQPGPLAEREELEPKKAEKRKREDEEEEVVLPSIEAQDEMAVDGASQQLSQPAPIPPPAMVAPPMPKRARTKSYSPPYKPYEECTADDLARPPHNYAVLLYMVLQDTGEITLRRIYKEMQYRWPFFKYGVDSDGWTSSVRHNLNQEVGKLFERGRKEGKGFTWLPKPNAMAEYQATKQKRSNAPALSRPRPQPPRPNFPGTQGQQLTWQNNSSTPQANRPNGAQAPPGYQQANGGRPPQQPPQPGHPPGFGPPGRLPLDPTFVPRDDEMHKFIGLPAPRFFPITFEGGAVLYRFESTMMKGVATTEEKRKLWSGIFQSVRKRALYGAKESSLEGGEIADESMIMQHFDNFIKQFKNDRFAGFDAAPIAPGSLPLGHPHATPTGSRTSQPPQVEANRPAAISTSVPAASAPTTQAGVQSATTQSAQSASAAPRAMQPPVPTPHAAVPAELTQPPSTNAVSAVQNGPAPNVSTPNVQAIPNLVPPPAGQLPASVGNNKAIVQGVPSVQKPAPQNIADSASETPAATTNLSSRPQPQQLAGVSQATIPSQLPQTTSTLVTASSSPRPQNLGPVPSQAATPTPSAEAVPGLPRPVQNTTNVSTTGSSLPASAQTTKSNSAMATQTGATATLPVQHATSVPPASSSVSTQPTSNVTAVSQTAGIPPALGQQAAAATPPNVKKLDVPDTTTNHSSVAKADPATLVSTSRPDPTVQTSAAVPVPAIQQPASASTHNSVPSVATGTPTAVGSAIQSQASNQPAQPVAVPANPITEAKPPASSSNAPTGTTAGPERHITTNQAPCTLPSKTPLEQSTIETEVKREAGLHKSAPSVNVPQSAHVTPKVEVVADVDKLNRTGEAFVTAESREP